MKGSYLFCGFLALLIQVNPISAQWVGTGMADYRIAFNSIRGGSNIGVFVMTPNDTVPIPLVDDSSSNLYPEWSPDGSMIVFVHHDSVGYSVHVIRNDGTGRTFIADSAGDDYNERPVWSPSGEKIVYAGPAGFVGGNGIRVMNPDGSDRKLLAVGTSPSWSKDGVRIAFQSGTPSQVFVMDSDGTNLAQLTHDSLTGNSDPDWSPDGAKIAFRSQRDGNSEVYSMDADGKNQLRLTNHPNADGFPRWSPDGTRIVFVRGDTSVYVVNPDGTNEKEIGSAPRGRSLPSVVSPFPRWSPDGTRVLFVSTGANSGIYVMNSDGTNQHRLTSGFEVYPAWSPIPFPTHVVSDEPRYPREYSLGQNYPNPFNPTTTFSFHIPHSAFIILKAYNVLGQEVATLVNENLAAGRHEVQWNAEEAPSGAYFYRLQSGSYSETKKAILIR